MGRWPTRRRSGCGRLDKERNGLFCTSAIAIGVAKHRRTTERAERIIAIDGCHNKCARRIFEADGFRVSRYLNLLIDFGIPKRGPFKPFEYGQGDSGRAIDAIAGICGDD